MSKYLFLVICLLTCTSNISIAEDKFWSLKQEGWFWYETQPEPEPELPEEEIKEEVINEVKVPPLVSPEPIEVIAHKKLQHDFEEKRSIAIMNPSYENVLAYLTLQQEILKKSAVFADVWQRIIWTNPQLDYQYTHRPTNAVALNTWEQNKVDERGSILTNLAKDHGLFFIFDDNCIYCQQMSTTLNRIANKHNFVIQAIAIKDAKHPAFPYAWPDNGFAKAMKINNYPALLLARLSDDKEEVIPIGYGALAESEIEERIAVLTAMPVGTRF